MNCPPHRGRDVSAPTARAVPAGDAVTRSVVTARAAVTRNAITATVAVTRNAVITRTVRVAAVRPSVTLRAAAHP
ncbi:hypothetical protein [Streptomyces sp. NPDC048639]|uniref:hypothetical protein n=1 Tax=Streptomyces sp. NPDC048639 TaxID=3365581 RepID=UPI00371D081E